MVIVIVIVNVVDVIVMVFVDTVVNVIFVVFIGIVVVVHACIQSKHKGLKASIGLQKRGMWCAWNGSQKKAPSYRPSGWQPL